MRTVILALSCLLAVSVPAVANEIDAGDVPPPLPKAARSSGFDPSWRWVDDDALLLQLADDGDPAARADAWWRLKDPRNRLRWREAIRRSNDPAASSLESLDLQDKFLAGEATAMELHAVLLKASGDRGSGGPTALETLVLGAAIPGWRGNPYDEFWLADWTGHGVPGAIEALCRVSITPRKVIPETIHYCRRLAKRGDADAAYRLGILYQRRADDFAEGMLPLLARGLAFRPDLPTAIRFYRRAAASGHAGAQARLAHLAAIGRGMPRDDAEALALAQAAAARDNPEGLAVLGLLTLEGRGLPADAEAGAALVRKAAERGNRMAQYTLSTLHVRGLGVAPDWVEAVMWLRLGHLDLPNDHRGAPAPEEYGNLMIEPWPRTTVVGAYYRMAPDGTLDAETRAIALRKRLAAEGLWPY